MITCPTCHQTADPYMHVGAFALCGACGDTLLIPDDGAIRKATGADVDQLTPTVLQQMRTGLMQFRKARG